LRSGPGLESPILTGVASTQYVYVMDGPAIFESGPWYKVDYDGTIGWVLGTYLGTALPRLAFAPSARVAAARQAANERRAPAAPAPVVGPPPTTRGESVAQRAQQFVGSPYAWGGSNPRSGFDCSGLIAYVYASIGVNPGRTSEEQAGAGVSVTGQSLAPGDIVVFANTYAGGYSHTGIYIGGGRFVHAEDYGTGVIVSSVFGGYWGRHYAGARRVL
jgi:cell wall-associated NlpC family hydrolase